MEKIDWLVEQNEQIMTADGFDYALIGICERAGQDPIAVYDTNKCLAVLRERDDMTYEEAHEYFYYNVVGAWVGEYTPCFVTLYEED